MFDGLFKPKFYTKCKNMVKLTKTRVEMVKRRKTMVCKYLKNDIADLLKNNLDYNAYCRTEGLLDEQKRLSCYDLLEHFCACVGSNVTLLQKSRECPEECREAVSTLIYAAARVSEVPELRDLRSLFTDRYGNSHQHFVNQEFVEKFTAKPPSQEMKLQLLHDIASEISIQWDSGSLQHKLYGPPRTQHVQSNIGPEQKNESSDEGANGSATSKPLYSNSEVELPQTRETCERDSLPASWSSISGDEQESKKPFYYSVIPAPYSRPETKEEEESIEAEASAGNICRDQGDGSASEAKPKPRSVRRRLAKPPPDDKEARTRGSSDAKQEEMRTTIFRGDGESLYPLKPPPSRHLKCDSMDKASLTGDNISSEGTRRQHLRTTSLQPQWKPPDYEELAARLDDLRRKH